MRPPVSRQLRRCFNSRSRVGSDIRGTLKSHISNGFNSRSRVGSDLRTRQNQTGSRWVSIHAPAWGATRGSPGPRVHSRSFNSRSRVGSDLKPIGHLRAARVSIHAPAWGATCRSCRQGWTREFQFTLPRGERLMGSAAVSCSTSFQFTLPRGERPVIAAGRAAAREVSIHAPAWGATPYPKSTPPEYKCFNSRSRVGSDGSRRRVRRRAQSFNSRSRVGSDTYLRPTNALP